MQSDPTALTHAPSRERGPALKALMICLSRFGGPVKCASNLAMSLSKTIDMTLMISSAADRDLLPENVPTLFIGTGKSKMDNIGCTLNPMSYRRIYSMIGSIKPDVIHFPVEHTWHLFLHPGLHSFPLVQTIHDPRRHIGEENRFFDFIRRVEIGHSDRVIVMSSTFRNAFESSGLSAERVDVIPHGAFEFNAHGFKRGSIPPPPLRKNVLFAGRISPYKGVDILLKAFTQVHQSIPDATLTIAGSGDLSPYRNLLQTARNVRTINRYLSETEMAELHSGCDFVVAPYIDASQSGVVALALSNGRAVIATKVGGLAEQVLPGETGILVEPGSVSELADAMKQLLTDKELNLRVARNARADYESRFTWDAIALKTIDTYLMTIENHSHNLRSTRSDAGPLFSRLLGRRRASDKAIMKTFSER